MARKLQDVIASFPVERQNAIHQGAQHLIAEELHRRNLKKNAVLSQQKKLINDNHEAVSKKELTDNSDSNIEHQFNVSKKHSPSLTGKKPGRNKRKTTIHTSPSH